jgi:hypothetical protein
MGKGLDKEKREQASRTPNASRNETWPRVSYRVRQNCAGLLNLAAVFDLLERRLFQWLAWGPLIRGSRS